MNASWGVESLETKALTRLVSGELLFAQNEPAISAALCGDQAKTAG